MDTNGINVKAMRANAPAPSMTSQDTQPIGNSTMQTNLAGTRVPKHIEPVCREFHARQIREKIALALIYEATNRKPAAFDALNKALEELATIKSKTNATLIAEIEVIQHRLH
jgi:hypothetical protein